MQILLACAKTMTSEISRMPEHTTIPEFQSQASANAMSMGCYSVADLENMLKVNNAIASETWHRYHDFFVDSTRVPAGMAYDGIVFKRLGLDRFPDEALAYANTHLNICSFLYGLLRPLDLINPYRLEGHVELQVNGGKSMFESWRPLLTDYLISKTQADDGILVNLASDEMRLLFDWRKVAKSVNVITPVFKVEKQGRLRTVVVYAKMCRGAMTRHILLNRLSDPGGLATFDYEGFTYSPELSASPSSPLFVLPAL